MDAHDLELDAQDLDLDTMTGPSSSPPNYLTMGGVSSIAEAESSLFLAEERVAQVMGCAEGVSGGVLLRVGSSKS